MTMGDRWSRRRYLEAALLAPLSATLKAEGPTVPTAPPNLFWQLARRGGCLMVMRHSPTVPGLGDPPGWTLANCATQRNLSDSGRAQARRLGERFRQEGVVLTEVRSSAWCRCQDTADLAFGSHQVWQPLNSFFETPDHGLQQVQAMKAEWTRLRPPANWMWVTHQVNITALTGQVPSMGEVYLINTNSTAPGPVPVLARWQP